MIKLTRLNGKSFLLNGELVKFVEETPDTVVSLLNGVRLVVQEQPEAIVGRVVEYGRAIRAFHIE